MQKVPAEKRQSCGAVIIREEEGKRRYLLLHYEAGHWDFPKGGLEANETPEMTVRRELREETGITDLEFIDGFKESYDYFFTENEKKVHKTVTFFIGKTGQKTVRLSFEHTDFSWLEFEDALEKLTYDNAKKLLVRADEFMEDLD